LINDYFGTPEKTAAFLFWQLETAGDADEKKLQVLGALQMGAAASDAVKEGIVYAAGLAILRDLLRHDNLDIRRMAAAIVMDVAQNGEKLTDFIRFLEEFCWFWGFFFIFWVIFSLFREFFRFSWNFLYFRVGLIIFLVSLTSEIIGCEGLLEQIIGNVSDPNKEIAMNSLLALTIVCGNRPDHKLRA
jgi:hypothetical protein